MRGFLNGIAMHDASRVEGKVAIRVFMEYLRKEISSHGCQLHKDLQYDLSLAVLPALLIPPSYEHY